MSEGFNNADYQILTAQLRQIEDICDINKGYLNNTGSVANLGRVIDQLSYSNNDIKKRVNNIRSVVNAKLLK